MAVDSDKYYPRDINAAARENSHGGRPRETFRPARLFLRPRETLSGRKRATRLEEKVKHVPSVLSSKKRRARGPRETRRGKSARDFSGAPSPRRASGLNSACLQPQREASLPVQHVLYSPCCSLPITSTIYLLVRCLACKTPPIHPSILWLFDNELQHRLCSGVWRQ